MRLLLPLALLLAGCAEEAATPSQEQGPVRRVVSLLPAFTEVVVGLGAADRLVGCTPHCRPGCDVAVVGWQGAGAAEEILRRDPDLVLRQRTRAADDPVLTLLERAGVRVLAIPSETIADARSAIVEIGDALSLSERAGEFLADFDRRLEQARAGARGKSAPKVLFVFGRDPGAVANIHAAGPGTFLDEMIRFAGGRNALADLDSPYPAISLDTFVRVSPDVIIDNLPPEEGEAFRDAWSRFAELVPAVRDGRIHAVRDPALLIPGPRLPEAVRRLVGMIHGE